MITAVIFILGLIIGSFLNVIIYRVSKGESIVLPASHCTLCGEPIKWYDNIPVISFIILKGRCRQCKDKISFIYPLIELSTALIFVLFFFKFSLTLILLKYLIFSSILIALSAIDFRCYILPNSLTYPLAAVGFIFSFFSSNFLYAVSDAAIAASGLYLIGSVVGKSISKEALGFGDVKLVFAITLFIGLKGIIFTLFFGSILGIAGALLFIKKREIPFGPFLSAAALFYPLLGNMIYHGLF